MEKQGPYPEQQPPYPQDQPPYGQGQPPYPQAVPPYLQGQPPYSQGQPPYPQEQPPYPSQGQPPYPQTPPPKYNEHIAQYPAQHGTPPQQHAGFDPYGSRSQPVVISSPQQYTGAPEQQMRVVTVNQHYVNDHLPYSIFVCLCCCWCIGIFAIVKSCRVREERDKGNIEAAKQLSREALRLAHIALGVGIVVTILYIVLAVIRNLLMANSY